MDSALHTPPHPAATPVLGAVLREARDLQRARRAGTLAPLLRGRRLGLITDEPSCPAAQLFERAAVELGAQVSHVQPRLSLGSAAHEIAETARLLGRLYDALECQGLAPALVEQLARCADVPVFDGLAETTHASAPLAALLDDDTTPAARRCCVVQAVLVGALA